MEEDKIRRKLEELHVELLNMEPADPAEQERIDLLAAEIEGMLSETNIEGWEGSIEELVSDSLASFEVEHPRIFDLLQGILRMVSDMGI